MYEGLYQASNMGAIKSLERKIVRGRGGVQIAKERILKHSVKRSGYHGITLNNNKCLKYMSVHRAVMLAFRGESKLHVDHLNGIKSDNRLENLEYVTPKENTARYRKTQTHSSIYAGVSWDSNSNKWYAYKHITGKRKFLGRHSSEHDAALAVAMSNWF